MYVWFALMNWSWLNLVGDEAQAPLPPPSAGMAARHSTAYPPRPGWGAARRRRCAHPAALRWCVPGRRCLRRFSWASQLPRSWRSAAAGEKEIILLHAYYLQYGYYWPIISIGCQGGRCVLVCYSRQSYLVQVGQILHAVHVVGVHGPVRLVVGGVAHVHGDGVHSHSYHACGVTVACAVRGQPGGGLFAQACGKRTMLWKKEGGSLEGRKEAVRMSAYAVQVCGNVRPSQTERTVFGLIVFNSQKKNTTLHNAIHNQLFLSVISKWNICWPRNL